MFGMQGPGGNYIHGENLLFNSNDGMFSGDRVFGAGGKPDSFSDRFSSIDLDKAPAGYQDDLENTLKIGRGGSGDADEDVRLFRDIEIRLKIEPLTLKLLHSITERIRAHVHQQGKLALGNVIGLLYQQCVKLMQRGAMMSPSGANVMSGDRVIKALREKNAELSSEVGALQTEVRGLRVESLQKGGSSGANENMY